MDCKPNFLYNTGIRRCSEVLFSTGELCILGLYSHTDRLLILYILLIKYLRYNARSDWSKVCNMHAYIRVYIRGQRFSARACTYHRFKIFYQSNIKRSIVSIYCDINTLEVVEHSVVPRVPLKLRLVLYSSYRVYNLAYRHALPFHIP
jgi:hypothetical protein